MPSVVTCPYCTRPAVFLRSGHIGYPYRRDFGPVWKCGPCGAWVGCHPDSLNAPLGTLADQRLRKARWKAHRAFDPLWKARMVRLQSNQSEERRYAYAWLAESLGMTNLNQCHIGEFDEALCARVIEICKTHKESNHGFT